MARLRVASIFVTYMTLGLARHDSATSVASHCRGNALLIRVGINTACDDVFLAYW